MNRTKNIAYLRQLCCSGLSKEVVIPEFLRAVQTVIPSGSNVFSSYNKDLIPYDFLVEPDLNTLAEVNKIAPHIIADFFTPIRTSRFIYWLTHYPALTDAKIMENSFYNSDLYHLIFRPADQHHGLWMLVMLQGRPAGIINLFRPHHQKPFKAHEVTLMSQLLPYVSHALQATEEQDIQYCEQGESGLMIMDAQGHVHFMSYAAKNLFTLACYPTSRADNQDNETKLLAKLAQLCRNLNIIFQGKHASPPSWSFCNGRGRFVFKAYWLDKQNTESDASGMIGMTIEHQEPLSLKVLRSLQNKPLSPTQKKVALLITQGLTNDQIGKKLGLKLNTIKDYVGKIFTQLDINHREELLPKLLALEKAQEIQLH